MKIVRRKGGGMFLLMCITFFASFSYSVSDKKLLRSQAICKGQPCSKLANLAWTQFPNIMTGCSMRGCKFVCALARTLLSLPSAFVCYAADRKSDSLSRRSHIQQTKSAAPEFSHTDLPSTIRENRIKWIMMGVVFNHLWPDVGAKKSDYRRKPALAISCFFFNVRTMRVLWVAARSTATARGKGDSQAVWVISISCMLR
jgi:hypothetical protein